MIGSYKVYIADKDRAVTSRITMIIKNIPEFKFSITRFTSLSSLITNIKKTRHDLLIVNPNLKDSSGLQTIKTLLNVALPESIIVVIDSSDDTLSRQIMNLGVLDCVIIEKLNAEHLDKLIKLAVLNKKMMDEYSLYKAIFNSTENGILVVNNNGKIIDYNDNFLNIWKIPVDLLQKGDLRVFLDHAHDLVEEGSQFLNRIEGENIKHVDQWNIINFKDGRIIEGHFCALVRDNIIKGRILSFRDISRNYTSAQILRTSEERFRTFTDALADIIFEMSIEGCITFMSAAVEKISGYKPEEIIGKYIYEFLPDSEMDNFFKSMSIIIAGGKVDNLALNMISKYGSPIALEVNSSPIYRNDEIVGVQGIVRDITERKRAEEALRQSEKMLNALFDAAKDCIFIKDRSVRYVKVNTAAKDYFGVQIEKVLNRTDSEIFDEEITHRQLETDQRVFQGEIVEEEMTRIIDDKQHTFHTIKVPLRSSKGDVIGLCGIARDITELRMADIILGESEEKLRRIAEQSFDILYELDLEGKILYISAASERVTGYKAEEIIGTQFYKYAQKYELPKVIHTQLAIIKGESALGTIIDIKRKDGTIATLEINASPITKNGIIIGSHGIARDITERKQSLEALQESEKKFRDLFEAAGDAIFIHNFKGRFLEVNELACKRLGYSREELLNKSLKDIDSPEFVKLVPARMKELKKAGQIAFETEHMTTGGEKIPIEVNAKVINYKGTSAILSIARDITDRKQAEEALIAEKESLSVTVRSIRDGVITTDIDGGIILLNKAAEELTGWSQEEATGENLKKVLKLANLVTGDTTDTVGELLRIGNINGYSGQCMLRDRDGRERMITVGVAPISDKDSVTIGYVLVFQDITERRRIEEELLKAQKLESVGILAGGIAHDFNNILAAILVNVTLAKEKAEHDRASFKRLAEAERALERARNLTQQLLTFSRGGEPIKEISSISTLLIETVKFVLTGSNIKCEFSVPDNLPAVEIDRSQINQAINNIVINSMHAMSEGGLLKLKVEHDKEMICPDTIADNGYIKISITDEGPGIPEDILPKIFDPYFTTKPKGSGLGLATAYSVIKKHNGCIKVESKIGKGATFDIYLPASGEIEPMESIDDLTHKGEGRVLIMDDEEIVRTAAGDLLEHLGYEVVITSDGDEMINVYKNAKESGNPFKLVIMDLTIPGGTGGKKAIEKLLKVDPKARAVASSGYSTDPIMSDYKKYGFKAVISKPFTKAEIVRMLNYVFKDDN